MPELAQNRSSFFAGFLQFDVEEGEIDANLSRLRQGLAELAGAEGQISPGIIVLPELWATGFAYEKLAALAGLLPDIFLELRSLAAQYQVYLAGSLPEYTSDGYYNTLYITGPGGESGTYRKQRLFSPMAEDGFFTPGNGSGPVQTSLGLIAGLICYDLRFPELLRRQTAMGATLAVVSAQWPAARQNHWRILLQARAIENQIFVVAANRCGITGDTTFGGHSMLVGPDGSILLEAGKVPLSGGMMLDPALVVTARAMFCTVPESERGSLG